MEQGASFGQWVLGRRRELGLQRPELATQVGCAAVTLRKIESDERRPSRELAALLAERLGLPPGQRATFVRVARGELAVDRLPALPLGPAAPAARHRAPTPLPTNLPAPLTSFVGRGEELATIAALLQTQRLVTLTGVGGVGKTRLAIEAGVRLVRGGDEEIAPDGVWIVDLAALAEPALVAPAMARAFRLPEQPGRSAIGLLEEHLAERQLLLILDNCEHLVASCAEIAERLLLHCWQLRVLATSREPLRVLGERALPVLPLGLPEPGEARPAQVLGAPAPQLFVARMGGSGEPAQPLDDAGAAALAQICHKLDGIPLAIELAAPLAQRMALDEIARQLEQQMAILVSDARTAIPRHQTMHRALVWSYRLLAPEEQRLLASCAVFAGGWTREAAEAVCADGAAGRVLPILQRLVATSLALQEGIGGQARYRLLEPVRQFARAQLTASGAEEAVCRRHAEHFLALAAQMYAARDTARELAWLDTLEPERDNLRAANRWAIARGEAELAQRLNGYLFPFWIYRVGNFTEARGWLAAALALRAPAPTAGAQEAEALALDVAGYLAVAQSDYAHAEACFQRQLDLFGAVDDQAWVARGYGGLGFVAMLRGDLGRSAALTARYLEIAQASGDGWNSAWALFDLGYLALVRGDLARAQDLIERALPDLSAQGNTFGPYRALVGLGHVMRGAGDNGRAGRHYREALAIQQRMHYVQVVPDALGALAGIAVACGDPERAAVLLGADRAACETYGMGRWPHLDAAYARDMALARSQLGPERWEAAWERGYRMSLSEAVAYALLPSPGPRP